MVNYFALQSVIWAVVISWTLYTVVVDYDTSVEFRMKRYATYSIIIPAILSFPPAAFGYNGLTDSWCWI